MNTEEKVRIAFVDYGGDFQSIGRLITKTYPSIDLIEIGSIESLFAKTPTVLEKYHLVFLAFNYTELLKREREIKLFGKLAENISAKVIAFGIIPPVGYQSTLYKRKIKPLKALLSKTLPSYVELDLNKYRIYQGRSEDFIQRNGYFSIYRSVAAIINIAASTGFVNIDFADINLALKGRSVVGTGYGIGESRVQMALFSAFQEITLQINPRFAKSVLINIVGGEDFALTEYHEIQTAIHEIIAKDAIAIVGFTESSKHSQGIEITVILSSHEAESKTSLYPFLFNFYDQKPTEFERQLESLIEDYGKTMGNFRP